jgi:hypothetical protein
MKRLGILLAIAVLLGFPADARPRHGCDYSGHHYVPRAHDYGGF